MFQRTPRDLGLPHDTFRPGQKDAYEKVLKLHNSGGGTIVIEAPTGTGKSGIPTALGADDNVLVLAHNHGLLRQYEQKYGFDIILGKQAYECALPAKVKHWKEVYGIIPTASDCHMSPMTDCPSAYFCPYLLARQKAQQSKRTACTYKYAALSEWTGSREGIIVMDEAHDAYEELIEFSKFTMDDRERKDCKLSKFPLMGFGQGGKGDVLEGDNRTSVMEWVIDNMKKISKVDLFNEMTQDTAKNKRLFERMNMAVSMLATQQPLFYKCTTPSIEDDWRGDIFGNYSTTMEIRSLDVKSLVHRIVGNKDTSVMMSATIGNARPLMYQLGINNFQYERYPHPTPKDKRPIFDLGVEKMTKANLDTHPGLYKKQADSIAEFIRRQDKSWRAIVLTSSNYKIGILRNALVSQFNGRVYIPKRDDGLKQQIQSFMGDPTPGKIAVGTIQGWGSGISFDGDLARISVVAGISFANPGDRFDQLRMSTDTGKQYAFWNAYQGVVQATGRVSRGEIDEDGEFELNVSAIADGSATTPLAKMNYSEWFKEAIVKWK